MKNRPIKTDKVIYDFSDAMISGNINDIRICSEYIEDSVNHKFYITKNAEIYEILLPEKPYVIRKQPGLLYLPNRDDYLALENVLVGNCKWGDVIFATDPSLGRQVRINYATYNSRYPLTR